MREKSQCSQLIRYGGVVKACGSVAYPSTLLAVTAALSLSFSLVFFILRSGFLVSWVVGAA